MAVRSLKLLGGSPRLEGHPADADDLASEKWQLLAIIFITFIFHDYRGYARPPPPPPPAMYGPGYMEVPPPFNRSGMYYVHNWFAAAPTYSPIRHPHSKAIIL